MRRLTSAMAAAILGVLAFAATALAQDPTGRAYGGQGPDIDNEIRGAGQAGEVAGTLPFTGRDLAFVVLTALVLMAVGLLTRRLARPRSVIR